MNERERMRGREMESEISILLICARYRSDNYIYLEKRVPTAVFRKTRHRSQMCTHIRKYFQVPSTSQEAVPLQTKGKLKIKNKITEESII